MLSLIPLILGFMGKLIDPIANVTTAIINEKIARTNATTDQEHIKADESIAALESKRAVLVAESGNRANPVMRFLLALGPMFIINKILIWDKALGLGSTDALDANLWLVIGATISFYFVDNIVGRLKARPA